MLFKNISIFSNALKNGIRLLISSNYDFKRNTKESP